MHPLPLSVPVAELLCGLLLLQVLGYLLASTARSSVPCEMKTILQALVLLGLVSVGWSLKCYVCNSHNQPDCTSMPENVRENYIKECNEGDDKTNYTLCRKLHMFLDQDFGETHPSEDRVHRACGFVEDADIHKRGDCYYKSGYNTRTWVCSCNYDQCNTGTQAYSLSSALTMLMPCIAWLAGYLRGQGVF